ncbi:hypothetical protein BOX15_Mlig029183g1 [Macrostomum lignano]|uniref:Cytochrome P450 n=1 Tax=Macrostomum lignano TaxID=282301 RepID=A0A267H6K4_9PLAT|nr:hypothetical protein BOX15_Mlig029183g1 [Macrostomum lignano]
MFLTVSLCVLAFVLYFVLVAKAPKSGDPPSPGWYPLVGSLPFLREPLEEFLSEKQFAKQPVVVLYMGLEKLYCLNTYEAIKDAFISQGDKFLGRQQTFILPELTGEKAGIILSEDEQWRLYRRLSLKTLRDFGFGRQGAEEIILGEVEELRSGIEDQGIQAGLPLDTVPLLSTAVSNVICQMVFGTRLASEDPEFGRVLEMFQRITQSQNNRTRSMVFQLHQNYYVKLKPLLRLVIALRRKQINIFGELIKFCRKQLEKHKADLGSPEHPRDYIEAFLHQQASNPSEFNDVRLSLAVLDLFIAGTDTTSQTLRWAILFLIENPEVEKRLVDEIKRVVGSDRQVTMKDKSQLHYTQAVIDEVNRMACLAQLGVAHRCTETARVCGYEIPKDALVLFNIFNVHNSVDHFPQPECFRPERHLDQEGRYSPDEHLVTFGIGKRACLGESLARMELFLFLTNLVQRFTFRLDPEETRTIAEIKANPGHQGGGIRAPAVHKIKFDSRREEE